MFQAVRAPVDAPNRTENAMTRTQWLWMQASLAVMAAASAIIRRDAYAAAAAQTPASPAPLGTSDA
jgi:hypothetical protein